MSKERDQLVAAVTGLVANITQMAADLNADDEKRETEQLVTAKFIATTYGVTLRWVYNRAEKLGAIRYSAKRHLRYRLSTVKAEMKRLRKECKT